MEKNIFKKNVYIRMTESVCYAAEINATLYINCTSVKKSFIFFFIQNIPLFILWQQVLIQYPSRDSGRELDA